MAQRIDVDVTASDTTLINSVFVNNESININVDSIYGTYKEVYTGSYVVEPDWEEQTLNTRNKIMHDNVTVEGIYLASVQNPSGGNTVYIGGVINDG